MSYALVDLQSELPPHERQQYLKSPEYIQRLTAGYVKGNRNLNREGGNVTLGCYASWLPPPGRLRLPGILPSGGGKSIPAASAVLAADTFEQLPAACLAGRV